MATLPLGTRADARGEARFFFIMAVAMAATIVGGFSLNIAMGRSSFAAPALVHVHAFVMMGWVTLYVLQNGLIAGGNHRLHRRFGWLAVAWIPATVVMGLLITRWSLQAVGGPPFFDQNAFLVGNPLGLMSFAGLAAWAIVVRTNTGWHRRLMFCSMAILTGPGLGRLLPMPLFIPWAWWISNVVPLAFPLIGMLADRRRYGRVHPAWFWGVGTIVMMFLVGELLAYSQIGYGFTEWFLEGTPGAERQMGAFVPPM
jgi:hypothetical protein